MMPIGVLIDFDLASYPIEMVNKILGITLVGDKIDDATPNTDAVVNATNNSSGTASLIPYPTGACQDRSGTTPFMAIETLDLSTAGYKHHLSHDLESIFYASVWHGVGYKYDQKQYPMMLIYTDDGEKEVDLLRFWRVGSWKRVVKEKEAFLGAPRTMTRYIDYAMLAATCRGLAGLFHKRRTASKEATRELNEMEDYMADFKKITEGIDGIDSALRGADMSVIAAWAARKGLNSSIYGHSDTVSKPLVDPIYPEYVQNWFLVYSGSCKKSCCQSV